VHLLRQASQQVHSVRSVRPQRKASSPKTLQLQSLETRRPGTSTNPQRPNYTMRLNLTSEEEHDIRRAEEADSSSEYRWSIQRLVKTIDKLDSKVTEQSVEIVRLKSQLTTHGQKTNP
jgi:hypothetical protein